MIGAVLAMIGLGRDVVQARRDLKVRTLDARARIEDARAVAASRAAEAGATWEQLAVAASETSWKDEWFTIILSIPLVLSFVPAAQPYVEAGFAALDATPEWYQWAVLAAISFAFGRKVMPAFKGRAAAANILQHIETIGANDEKEEVQEVRRPRRDEKGLEEREGKAAVEKSAEHGHEKSLEVSKKFTFGARSEKCLEGVHHDLVRVARRALELSAEDFGLHCGVRSKRQQRALVAAGKSWTLNSRHLTGHALDAHPSINGEIPWEDWAAWESMAATWKRAARELGVPIEWGGDWRKRDGPHFQLPRDQYPK